MWVFVEHENQKPYDYMYETLTGGGLDVLGIVVDGRRSFYTSFNGVPIQMCHFHMAKILSRYLTRNPNLKFNQDLWEIWYKVKHLSQELLQKALFDWYCRYSDELTEGYIDPKHNRWVYSRERTLKAYKSFRRFIPYLFTYKTSKWISNTNNSLEGMFGQMKKKINIHNGLRVDRLTKIIHYYLREQNS